MPSPPKNPAEIVKIVLTALLNKDFETALPYISDSCEYDNVPMGKVHGFAGVRAVLEPFCAPAIENEFVTLRVVTSGATVIMERLDRHRLPTGWVELPVVGVFEVHDGRITLWRDYFDLATIRSKWPVPLAA